jgi:hypothetical protein
MKRHLSLQPLSREHHEALLLAQLLKKNAPAYKGLPLNEHEKIAYAVTFLKRILPNIFWKRRKLLS